MLVVTVSNKEPVLIGNALVFLSQKDAGGRIRVAVGAPDDVRVLRWDVIKTWLVESGFEMCDPSPEPEHQAWYFTQTSQVMTTYDAVQLALQVNPPVSKKGGTR